MKTQWDYVTTVESESEPGVFHDIKQRRSDGHLGCDCMSYRFAPKSAKTCKHIVALNEDPTPLLGGGGHAMVLAADKLAAKRVVSQGSAYTFTRRGITFCDIPVGR